jgi:hypothetical protein
MSKGNLPAASVRTLAQLKQQMSTEQAKRDALVDKGRRAYHLGIEEYNCPEKDPSARKLWSAGYKIAKEKFEALFPSRVRQ